MSALLNDAALPRLPADVVRPQYDRAQLGLGAVHLGLGAFHRAHQALVFDDLANAGDLRWGVTGVSLRTPDVCRQLTAQDGLYSLQTRYGDAATIRVVGAVRRALFAPTDAEALHAALAAPQTQIVTLTITEKGYHLASGALNVADPDIAHDIAAPSRPRTAIGLLTHALARRRASGLPAFTAISCDNLPRNGALLRDAVLTMAQARDPALHDWIAAHAAFPETMVDRIVPAPTEADRAAAATALGVRDDAALATEPFWQWVIENKFAQPPPDFESVGVRVAASVTPWERTKLRLLNGAHSAIAYLGMLGDVTYVHEFVADPNNARFIARLWNETEATLDPPPELDVAAYRDALAQRFANSALNHRCAQIAMDGSQKLPQRWLATIIARLERGLDAPAHAFAIAAWIAWLHGKSESGRMHEMNDPMAGVLTKAVSSARAPEDKVRAVFALDAIFPKTIREHPHLNAAVAASLTSILAHGVKPTLDA